MSSTATPRRPVVYLIAQPTVSRNKKPLNLDTLYEHGEVQLVLPQGDSPTFHPRRCMDVMERRLENFDPDVDYLVWAGGDTLSAVMAGMILANMDIWCFQWLRYERARLEDGTRTDEGARYTPVLIDLQDPDTHEGNSTEDMNDTPIARRTA